MNFTRLIFVFNCFIFWNAGGEDIKSSEDVTMDAAGSGRSKSYETKVFNGFAKRTTLLGTHDHRDAHGRVPCPVSQWWSRWVWCRRVYASHYRERLPVSVFLYLYPRLNSYGTSNTQANFPSASRNCVPCEYETAKRFGTPPVYASVNSCLPQILSVIPILDNYVSRELDRHTVNV